MACCSNQNDERTDVDKSCCDIEEKGGCCNGENESLCTDLCKDRPCEGSESVCDEQINDDSACNCCIQVLINEAVIHESVCTPTQIAALSGDSDCLLSGVASMSSPANGNDIADSAIIYLESYTNALRACCKALERYCSRRSCCFVSRPADHVDSSPSTSLSAPLQQSADGQNEAAQIKVAEAEIASDLEGEGKLLLEVRGMNCTDCMLKVGRALAQLPSVSATNLDYFSGIAELHYDPDIINPPAVVAYVARATGFSVRALTTASGDDGPAIITLPLSFPIMPPPGVLDGFDTYTRPNSQVIEISFSPHLKQPRDVFEHFKTFGAELVPAESDGYSDVATRDLINVGARTIVCAVLSIPVLVLAWANLPHRPLLYGAISIVFTTLIQGLSFPIMSSAIRSIVYLREIDLDVLVLISTLAAYIFSVVSFAFEVAGSPFSPPFFETTALLITLIFLGRTISATTRRSTGSALRAIQRLQPQDVLLLSGRDAPPQSLDSRLLYYGDVIRVLPETRIATDGFVISGSSDADESSVTGESVAVPKQNGCRVIAGTLNLSGVLDVQITQLVHENSLTRIATIINQAHNSRSAVKDLADKLSAIILPTVAIAACITFLIWVLIGHYIRHQSGASSVVEALTYAIAVLVVSCPCAIGLAVPAIISRAIRIGISEGLLLRSTDVLQTTHDINVIAFDKTGTLTQGSFTTKRVEIVIKGVEHIVMALVKDNKHPISQGVHRYLSAHLSAVAEHRKGTLTDIVSLPGKGIKAQIAGFPILGGSPVFTGACSHPLLSEFQRSGLTLFTVTLAGRVIALFGLVDTPRPNMDVLIAELARRGKDVMIFSGDTPSAVHHLANSIGVPVNKAYASHTPEDKVAAVVAMQAKGQRVCFIGDGTNDGPALSHADASLAVAQGSDVAVTAAGAVLLGSDLHRGVLALLDVSSAVRTHCRCALAWCILYNVFAILLASGAFVKARIAPRWAGIGEVVSILPVIGIAFMLDLRWAWRRFRHMRTWSRND